MPPSSLQANSKTPLLLSQWHAPSAEETVSADSHQNTDPSFMRCPETWKETAAFMTVGSVFMLTSAANWTSQSIINRYAYLYTLQELAIDQHVSHDFSGVSFTQTRTNNLSILCQTNLTSSQKSLLNTAQELTTNLLLQLSAATDCPAVVMNVVLGAYSDVMGRQLLFTLPIMGLLLNTLVTSLVLALTLSLDWLFVGSLLYGMFGGFGAIKLACYVYAVDIARAGGHVTKVLVALQALMGVAAIAAHVLIGFTLQSYWMFYPAIVSAFLSFISIVLVLSCLRDLRAGHEDEAQDVCSGCCVWSRVKNVCHRLKLFYVQPNAPSNTTARLRLGIFAFCFLVMPTDVRFRLLFMYEVNAPLCWSPLSMGTYRAFSEGGRQVMAYIIIKGLHRFLDDETFAVIGLISLAAGDAMTAYAVNSDFMYEASAAALAGAMPNPIIRSLMAQLVSPQRQGSVFASLAVFEGLFGVIGQSLYFMYRNTVEGMGGAVFIAMATSRLISALFILLLKQMSRGRHCRTEGDVLIGQDTAKNDHSNALNTTYIQNENSIERRQMESS